MKNNYRITKVNQARQIAKEYLEDIELAQVVNFGLPEIDDRYHIWRVPILTKQKMNIGEIVIDAITTLINEKKSTNKTILESRILGRSLTNKQKLNGINNKILLDDKLPKISSLRNTVGFGDCENLLTETPKESIDLIFTSPPYYNARPEYSEYLTYEEYLLKIKRILHLSYQVLNEGRFFVINISPVLIRRANRTEASKRIAVPFDFHRLFIEEGFEFIDDIIWVKPEGAGWATGRGRRFAADRNPLQYKPVPVTEYILVYRKKTERLIDWHIRKHPDRKAVEDSKIENGYETTNIWKIHPSNHAKHPAVFPLELAEKVIKYYSFQNDVILDPFAGIGTVGKAAVKLNRRFVLFEQEKEYIKIIEKEVYKWLHNKAKDINWINYEPTQSESPYFNF